MSDPLAAPPRRPVSALTLVLAIGFAITLALAVIFGVSLQAARERIDELEEQVEAGPGGGGGGSDPLEDLLEDVFGEGENPLEDLGGDVIGCIGPGAFGGEAVTPPEGPPAEQVRSLADEVEGIRELTFRERVAARFLGDEAIERRIRELFLEDYTPAVADRETRIFSTLGAIPPGIDLTEVRARAIGSSVAGFYVPETGELVVRASGGELGPLEWVTLVHELDHALTDQVLDLPVPDEVQVGREDRDQAALAVVEGDATLAMQRYSSSLPLDQQFGLLDPEAIVQAEAGMAGLPYILEQEMLFPYEDGLAFVCDLYQRGGWETVDRSYDDPPTTTAQILFPDRYMEGEDALDPRDTGRLGAPWRLDGTHELGAATLLWLFEAPGGDPARAIGEPEVGAGAWGGGELRLWTRGEASAVGLALAERPGTDVLCSAVTHWYRQSFPGADPQGSATGGGLLIDGGRQDAAIVCRGAQVRVGIAPDPAAARRLAG